MKVIATQRLADMTDNVKCNDILVIDNEVLKENGEEVHFIKQVDWNLELEYTTWNNGVPCHDNSCDCPCCYGHSGTETVSAQGQDRLGFYLEVSQGLGGLIEKMIYGQELEEREIDHIDTPLDEVGELIEDELNNLTIDTSDIIKELNQCEKITEIKVA